MVAILIASVIVSLVVVELSAQVFGGGLLKQQLGAVCDDLCQFSVATSDSERQKLLLVTAGRTFLFSVEMLLVLAALAAVVLFFPYYLDWSQVDSTTFYLVLTVVATVWAFLRLKLARRHRKPRLAANAAEGNYSLLDKFLHFLCLEITPVRRLSFELERRLFLPGKARGIPRVGAGDAPVYICGLARSGTTILLKILDQLDGFVSLTYRSMPFVLAPNLWHKLTTRRGKEDISIERAHGDGILTGYDSPEAFEEVFWDTFCKRKPDRYGFGYRKVSPRALARFADYRKLVVKSAVGQRPPVANGADGRGGLRYLSKNNNNLLRIPAIAREESASVLIVYRHPVPAAMSLYRQHLSFCRLQQDDLFVRAYMTWLGHLEFGLSHLPFDFARRRLKPELDPMEPDYWLAYWVAVHDYLPALLESGGGNVALVCHETVRERPREMLGEIFRFLGIDEDPGQFAGQIKPLDAGSPGHDFSSSLQSEASSVYRRLRSMPQNLL